MLNISNFSNAYKEVDTILDYMNEKDVNLIPPNFRNMIKSKMNEKHEFNYDITRSFDEQNILKETKAVFAYIFLNYWKDEKRLTLIKEKLKRDTIEYEKEKRLRYNPESVFKKHRKNKS